jgi:hypothetical protein
MKNTSDFLKKGVQNFLFCTPLMSKMYTVFIAFSPFSG